jgi:hypothetical protein
MNRPRAAALLAGMTLWAFWLLQGVAAEPLSSAALRGRRLYREGVSMRGGTVVAHAGNGTGALDGRLVPCARCHGFDGLGNPEHGQAPPAITGTALGKPQRAADSETRSAYSTGALRAAITQGQTPGGRPLSPAMPRYRMVPADLADLVAYLKMLGTDLDPGITPEAVRLGLVLPPAEAGQPLRESLRAHFRERNAQGGWYGRRIEPVFEEAGEEFGEAMQKLAASRVFAVIDLTAADPAAPAANVGLPLLVPLAGPLADRQIFYLWAGLEEQAAALLQLALHTFEADAAGIVLLHADGAAGTTLAGRIASGAGPTLRTLSYTRVHAARTVRELRGRNAEWLLYLAERGGLVALLREAAAIHWFPYILVPATADRIEGVTIPESFSGRILLAQPVQFPGSGVSQPTASGRPGRPSLAESLGLATVVVFEEALRRSGRDLSREKFLAALETFDDFETGLSPPLSFRPDRHIGSTGSYISVLRRGYLLPAVWVAID